MALYWVNGLPIELIGNNSGKYWVDGLPVEIIKNTVLTPPQDGDLNVDIITSVAVTGGGLNNASIIIDTLPTVAITGIRVHTSSINIDPVPTVAVEGNKVVDGGINIDPVPVVVIDTDIDVFFTSTLEANGDLIAVGDIDHAASTESNVDMFADASKETLTNGFIYYASTTNRNLSIPVASGDLIVNSLDAHYNDSELGVIRNSQGFGPAFVGEINLKSTQYDVGRDLVRQIFSQNEVILADFSPTLIIINAKPTYYVHDVDGVINDRFYIVDGVLGVINSQVAVEVLGAENSASRLTQVAVELLISPSSDTFLTQLAVEVLKLANLLAVKQVAVEAMHKGDISDIFVKQVAVEMLVTSPKKVRLTQTAVETLKGAIENQPVRLTQVAVETLREKTEASLARGLIQQNAIEFMAFDESNIRVKQNAFELVGIGNSNLRVKQDTIETLADSPSNLRVKQDTIEAVHDGQGDLLVKQCAIEILVKAEYDPAVSSLINNPKYSV